LSITSPAAGKAATVAGKAQEAAGKVAVATAGMETARKGIKRKSANDDDDDAPLSITSPAPVKTATVAGMAQGTAGKEATTGVERKGVKRKLPEVAKTVSTPAVPKQGASSSSFSDHPTVRTASRSHSRALGGLSSNKVGVDLGCFSAWLLH
jgi:hypothetical protein